MAPYSAAPGTPQTPTKAVVSAISTFVVIFAGFWIADEDPFTKKEMAEALITGLIGSGLTGGVTWTARNRATG